MKIDKLKTLMLNDEGFAFDPRTGNTFNINATGLEVMNGLKAGASVDELIQLLADKFDVDEQIAGRDLDGFLNELQRQRLIDMEEAS
jgi:PqqD family protein of HPr-rel-A system